MREWLRAMVATEYVKYDPQTDSYFMDEEQSTVLASEDSALFVGGSFRFAIPSLYNVPRTIDAFRRGAVFRIPNSAATCPVPSSASSVRVTSTNS